ncbi:hypothetical protein LCGC14_1715460 [marine sediment metagenome]|uniref:Uncharacterized protein n=1 Tax=marine sediment metagenome TaxID=412755 RepID=A0A0F9HDQ9_9ZZZZ
MAEAGPGKIRLFNDFFGGNALANTLDASNMGDFYAGGESHETTSGGVAPASFLSGCVAITSDNTDADTVFIGTGIGFDVALNGPIICETRVQMPDVDTKEIFFGITSILTPDEQLQDILINSSATVVTLTADLAGFYFSDELTASATDWHGVHAGGSTADGATAADITLGATVTAGEFQILRLEVDTNGTVRWLVDGDVKKTVVGAVSTTTDVAVCLAAAANTTQAAIIQVDYLLVKANRDWTV